jgi:Holliday junction resolvase
VETFRILTVEHKAWQEREPRVSRGQLEKLVSFLKERLDAGLCELGFGPYGSRWFVVPKKDGENDGFRICNR